LTLTEKAINLSSLPHGSKIVDIACGNCATVEYLLLSSQLKVIGIDLSIQLLREGRLLHANLPVIQASGERLPFSNGKQDAVLVECALSIMGVDKALQEYNRVLKIGGKLILSDVYIRNPDSSSLRCLPQTRCLTGVRPRTTILEHLKASGFSVLSWEDHSEVLKQWLTRMVFSFGSVENFYRHLTSGTVDMNDFQPAFSQLRLGYYLLIAEKQA
jgi:ubiquinone/menaquinone biosynthesis C-methylase UbiE